jgi:NhaP-type Na+/H+ or K+/H+ antiporter
MDAHTAVVSLAAVIALGISMKWLSWAINAPSILLLLAAGFLAGPILGWINPRELFGHLFLPIVSLSVAVVLFEGGLSLRFKDVREVGHVIRNLVTIGAAIGMASTALFLYYALGFSLTFSLLESAILIVTGPTVIIPMLSHMNVKDPVRSVLRWEGIIIDPIGAMAAVLIFDALLQQSVTEALGVISIGVIKTVVVGTVLGIAAAYFMLMILKKFWLTDELHNPVVLMLLFAAFTLSNLLQMDSGLICVTIMGVILANQKETKICHIVDFKENLRTILIAFLFIILAASIELEALKGTLWMSLLLLAFLIFIARPLSVLASSCFSELSWREIFFMSSLAPRGIIAAAISALFGLRLAKIGYPEAEIIAPITFTVIAGTVIFYGIATPLIAKWLKISKDPKQGVLIIGANALARKIGEVLQTEGYQVLLIDTDEGKATETKNNRLPVYHGSFLSFESDHPKGLEGMDKLFAMTENDDVNSLAVTHFARHFDQSNLYQLPAVSPKISVPMKGRRLFGDMYDFTRLSAFLRQGYEIKSVPVTSEFLCESWDEEYGFEAFALFYIRKNGVLTPVSAESTSPPAPGGKVVFMVKSR